MDESDLIRRAARRDESAWEDLMRLHQESVFRLAYLFTGDPDEAEDVTQEAFIRAFRSIETVDAARSFRPWILSVAANLARNRLRGLGRALAALTRLARRDPDAVAPAPPPGDQNFDTARLWRTVRTLRLDDQMIVYLRFYLEMSEEETCAALRIPAGTAKSRTHRALKRLRERLGNMEGEKLEGAARHE